MDPDETQMFVEAYWWRWEMEDRMQAHYAAQHLSAASGKKLKPKKVRFFPEWHYGDDGEQGEVEGGKKASTSRGEKVVSIAEHKRAKSALAASRARMPWGAEG